MDLKALPDVDKALPELKWPDSDARCCDSDASRCLTWMRGAVTQARMRGTVTLMQCTA